MFEGDILTIGFLLLIAQYALSCLSRSLTLNMMRSEFRSESILPLLYCDDIPYDVVLILWSAYLVAHHPEWSLIDWMISAVAGSFVSWAILFDIQAPATAVGLPREGVVVTQKSYVQNGEVVGSGYVRFLLLGMIFAIILNGMLFSKAPRAGELVVTSLILTGMTLVGNHMLLGFIKMFTDHPIDYRDRPLESLYAWLSIFSVFFVTMLVCIARCVDHLW